MFVNCGKCFIQRIITGYRVEYSYSDNCVVYTRVWFLKQKLRNIIIPYLKDFHHRIQW